MYIYASLQEHASFQDSWLCKTGFQEWVGGGTGIHGGAVMLFLLISGFVALVKLDFRNEWEKISHPWSCKEPENHVKYKIQKDYIKQSDKRQFT